MRCAILIEPNAWLPLQVDVVVGFSNGGEEAFNVSAIQGSLHSAAQWNLWVQNFTVAVSCMSEAGAQWLACAALGGNCALIMMACRWSYAANAFCHGRQHHGAGTETLVSVHCSCKTCR